MPCSPRPSPAATGFQFLHRSLIGGAAGFVEAGFHPLKAALELAIGFAQSGFGIDREVARDVDQHEKQIADFFFKSRLQIFRDGRSS